VSTPHVKQDEGVRSYEQRPAGITAAVVADCVGNRMLNKNNTVEAGGYTTLDASLGYHFGKYRLQLNGYNLIDRRDPVSESELQMSVTVTRTSGYYRLPSRSIGLSVSLDL
jgi:outer membrane receptor protein involved in Fe transport